MKANTKVTTGWLWEGEFSRNRTIMIVVAEAKEHWLCAVCQVCAR